MKKLTCFIFIIFYALNTYSQHNVVVIIADDLSPDYFGFYNNSLDTVPVPNIRTLASKGIRFTKAWSNPVCSATRAGIITGRYSFRTGVGGIVGGEGGSSPLDTSEVTIPKLLKAFNPNIGRCHIGKWHLQQPSPIINLLNPNAMGYQWYEGGFIGTLSPSYTNWTKCTNGVNSNITNYATSENVNNAVSWVKTQTAKPFFLWLAFNAPHDPLHLPPSNLQTYSSLSGNNVDINKNPKSYFKAMIQALDTEIGRLFDSLKAINRYDSTDFIFIGDNGNTARTAQIVDTSRAKGTVYQYGVSVPFIVAGPSVVNPGRVSDALVNTTDIFATVLELFGNNNWQTQIAVNKPVDSKSILPVIKNTSNVIRPWAFTEIFKLTPDGNDGKAIRNTNYKLIKFDNGNIVFYDLIKDSLETRNLLTSSMSNTDITNYNYLCEQMATLFGNTSYCNTIALPISLLNFNGSFLNNVVALSWATSAELNNSYFDIERSRDGNNFYKIGEIKGQLNSSIKTFYNFKDDSPLFGSNYYRLNQWDINGQHQFSNIITINTSSLATSWQLYPNPATNAFVITKKQITTNEVMVTISSMTGQKLQTVFMAKGVNSCVIKTDMMPIGTYSVTLNDNSIISQLKLVVSK